MASNLRCQNKEGKPRGHLVSPSAPRQKSVMSEMSVPILPGVCLACSWRPPTFPCGILCATALKASVAWTALISLPWHNPHACPWAQDPYFSPAQGHQSLSQQCCRMPGSSSTTVLLCLTMGPPHPRLLTNCLTWPWSCPITSNLPDDVGSGLPPLACLIPSWGQWDRAWLVGLCPASCGTACGS